MMFALAGCKEQSMPREGTDLQLPLAVLEPISPVMPCLLLLSLVLVGKLLTPGPAAYVIIPQLSDPARGIPGKQGLVHTQASLFLSLAHSLPFFGSRICLLW